MLVDFGSADSANNLVTSQTFKSHGLRAFILTYRTMRTGIVRDIPPSISVKTISNSIEAHPFRIIEVKRLQKRVSSEGSTKLVPSSFITIKFEGQILPKQVSIFKTRHEVRPFTPRPRTCFKCFRVGHIKNVCRGSERCLYCGNNSHKDDEHCPMLDKPLICINCKGNHLATSPDCPIVFRHKQILSLAATENIPLFETRKIIRSNTPTSISQSYSFDFVVDPRLDYNNFPRLVNKHPDNYHHKYSSLPDDLFVFHDNNIFNTLNNANSNGPQAPPHSSSFDSYASATANRNFSRTRSASHTFSHPITSAPGTHQHRGDPSLPRRPPPHNGQQADPNRDILFYPNGRSSFPSRNGIAFDHPNSNSSSLYARSYLSDSSSNSNSFNNFIENLSKFLIKDLLPLILKKDVSAIIDSSLNFLSGNINTNIINNLLKNIFNSFNNDNTYHNSFDSSHHNSDTSLDQHTDCSQPSQSDRHSLGRSSPSVLPLPKLINTNLSS